jgi:16S rRNA G966 N2-methylase RsmD
MTHDNEFRFLPSYVGSKRFWLPTLDRPRGRPFVEMFAGSAVLSANLASRALLVDLDPVVARILARFPEQIVPETFTRDDFYRVHSAPDWWRHVCALQSMSFSGVFRYSKNGYNVSAKGGPVSAKNKVNEFHLQQQFELALTRWKELDPIVHNGSYLNITDADISTLGEDVVVVLDPPYENSKAAYNSATFDYDVYWRRVTEPAAKFSVIIFDRAANIEARGYPVTGTRKMRVNGARPGDVEAMSLLLR